MIDIDEDTRLRLRMLKKSEEKLSALRLGPNSPFRMAADAGLLGDIRQLKCEVFDALRAQIDDPMYEMRKRIKSIESVLEEAKAAERDGKGDLYSDDGETVACLQREWASLINEVREHDKGHP